MPLPFPCAPAGGSSCWPPVSAGAGGGTATGAAGTGSRGTVCAWPPPAVLVAATSAAGAGSTASTAEANRVSRSDRTASSAFSIPRKREAEILPSRAAASRSLSSACNAASAPSILLSAAAWLMLRTRIWKPRNVAWSESGVRKPVATATTIAVTARAAATAVPAVRKRQIPVCLDRPSFRDAECRAGVALGSMPATERRHACRPDREDSHSGNGPGRRLHLGGRDLRGPGAQSLDGAPGGPAQNPRSQQADAQPKENMACKVLSAEAKGAERRTCRHDRSSGHQHHGPGDTTYRAHHSRFPQVHQQAY